MCRLTCMYNCPNFVNNCTTRKTFVCVQQKQQQEQNPCTVIPRRALPLFSAPLHFASLENQKCLDFHRSTTFQKLAETVCWLHISHRWCSLLLDEQFFKARTFSKFMKGAALRVPLDKLLLYLEQRLLKRISAGTQTTDNPKCCFVFEPSSLLWQFSFFILILRILLHTPALFLIWIIGTITVDDISSG